MPTDGSLFRIGQVVESKAGRDRGKHYLVMGRLDQRTYLVANGRDRSAGRPKRKNGRHLAPLALFSEIVAARVAGQGGLQDADLDRALSEFGF